MGHQRVEEGPTGLAALAEQIRPVARADQRLLEVVPDLARLLPHEGLRRGTMVEVDSPRLAMRLLAAATTSGSWAAVVGLPWLGLAAARELGVDLGHVVTVALPREASARVASVLGTLIDGVEVVVTGPEVESRLSGTDRRRLSAKARERGTVWIVLPQPVRQHRGDVRWESVEVRLSVAATRWEGVGQGYGHLQSIWADVVVDGRRAAVRSRRAWCWLGGARDALSMADGAEAGVEPVAPLPVLERVS